MIVTEDNFSSVVSTLLKEPELACDLETEGFYPWKGHRLFGMAFATKDAEYYFPFSLTPGDGGLPRGRLRELHPVFSDSSRLIINHNVQFDMNFLAREGLHIAGPVYCTMTMARIEYNQHMKYGLDNCAERDLGESKDDAVKKYMDEHKLYEWVSIPGKKTRTKNYFFHRVPLEIIGPYAEKDARLAFDLKRHQSETFAGYDAVGTRPVAPIVLLEQKTTRVLHELQNFGVRVDRAYCQTAVDYEAARIAQAEAEFAAIAGVPLMDSAKGLRPVLERFGIQAGKTPKGNDSYTSDVLESSGHPLVRSLLTTRDAKKRLGTYFSAFLYHSSSDGRVHSNIAPIAATARFTSRDPNLQNLSDEEDEVAAGTCLYPVRRALIPDPGCLIVSIDYKAQEFRMMLDQACQLIGRPSPLLIAVLNGKDVHQATADVASAAGVTIARFEAKISNFLTIYGGGAGKLAESLGCDFSRAQAIRASIFQGAPEIRNFISKAIMVAERRGYVYNWVGRRYQFPDSSFAYKAPNYLIQGGCSEVMRHALCAIFDLFQGTSGKLLTTIHDEVVFQILPKDAHLIPQVQKLMLEAYPHKYLPLETSVAYSYKSLGDLEDYTCESKTLLESQATGLPATAESST